MTKQPHPTRERVALIVAGAVIIVCAMALYGILQTRTQERDAAEQQGAEATERAETAVEYITAIDADCKGRSGPELAAELEKAGRCGQAEKITEQEPLEPINGKDGENGRGIAASAIVANDLILTYTDGTVINAGRVVGIDGKAGRAGATGRGITGASLTDVGDLVLAFTDGATINVGRVVGLNGKDGTTPDLTGYATEDWVRALIRALGCSITVTGNGPPLVLDCSVTGKP